jgi:hypothetical protein
MKAYISIKNKRAASITAALLILLFLSCSDFQKYLDKSGIESSCKEIMRDYQKENPGVLSLFLKNFSLAKYTEPFDTGEPEVRSIGEWKLDIPEVPGLIQEKLFFNTPLSALTHRDDKLVLYIYRKAEIKGGRVLLFVPGMGVSNFALLFIKHFFKEIISRGYILAVYVPPYHLDRIPPGKNQGEGFFTHDSVRNIKMIAGCTSEVRSAVKYFKLQGVSDISAWGGSMGGSFLLLSAEFETYSHITTMIPVLDWNTLLLDSPEVCELKKRLMADGYSEDKLRYAYSIVSPMEHRVITPPDKILILFAKYDQLTSLALLEKYRKTHNNPMVKIYNRSHATILTDFAVYDDYATQLDMWAKNKN